MVRPQFGEPAGSLYRVLGVSRNATAAQLRAAFRAAARDSHPDKGGDAHVFAAVRHAYETLSDPAARVAYDDLGFDPKFKLYEAGVSTRPDTGIASLLDELERLGLAVEPGSQLVCVCELCGRPSTKDCFVCTLRYCEFCTRKQHWKGRFGLHFPVCNSRHMVAQMGKRQLEAKRLEDGERAQQGVPQYRTPGQLKEIRVFKEVAALAHASRASPAAVMPGHGDVDEQQLEQQQRRLQLLLGRYYMWHQVGPFLCVAVHIPTGYSDKALKWVVDAHGHLLVQAEDSAPVVSRQLAGPLDPGAEVQGFTSEDNRLLALVLKVKEVEDGAGESASPLGTAPAPSKTAAAWRRLFVGDSDGFRCTQPPYSLAEGQDDVVLEWELPPGVTSAHLNVHVTADALDITVEAPSPGQAPLRLCRTFWRDEDARGGNVVDVPKCAWSLTPGSTHHDLAQRGSRLTVVLAKPPLTSDEVHYRQGKRNDNRAAGRLSRPADAIGERFFVDDADDFGLEAVVQALSFAVCGTAYVVPTPAQAYGTPAQHPFWATQEGQLRQAARTHLGLMRRVLDDKDWLDDKSAHAVPSRMKA